MADLPYTGGKALEAHLKRILEETGNAGTLRVGFLEGATYPDGTSVAMVAAVNEFGRMVHSKDGDYYQMPRPFFRNMITSKSPRWGAQMGRIAKANGYDMERTLSLMGEGIKGQLQASIQEFESVPLAQSTIDAKGFEKQLVESGHMQNSVDYQVLE